MASRCPDGGGAAGCAAATTAGAACGARRGVARRGWVRHSTAARTAAALRWPLWSCGPPCPLPPPPSPPRSPGVQPDLVGCELDDFRALWLGRRRRRLDVELDALVLAAGRWHAPRRCRSLCGRGRGHGRRCRHRRPGRCRCGRRCAAACARCQCLQNAVYKLGLLARDGQPQPLAVLFELLRGQAPGWGECCPGLANDRAWGAHAQAYERHSLPLSSTRAPRGSPSLAGPGLAGQ
jgi:hypothetical protein